ncbi:MAG: aspartyl protease family protein [Chloroflexota bacterium]|jgi:clan AA aspartic protease|nr:aspartyl protease family protein [Chloroflexota bacterium]
MSLMMDKDAETMGRITTRLIITNRADQIRAEDGTISPEAVRSVTLDDVLVDTGATTLCLPRDTIAALGLRLLREAVAETATGSTTMRIFQDAKISLLGREGTFECVELPEGRPPLLGVVPLEMLGAELDLQKQELRLLPMTPGQSYFMLY